MKTYNAGEKTHKDENFPVASFIIHKKHRAAVLAFYHFARAADDVADHPSLSEQEKISQLDQFEATLLGAAETIPQAKQLREALAGRSLTPRHAQDLLIAFRQDAHKTRYANWNELLDYCAYSAAPVGRFVLDVHGESANTWPASDALCATLQIINHLQDCKADYQRLNRIYLPQDTLAKHGVLDTDLAAPHASPELRQALHELTQKTQALLAPSPLSVHIHDLRLGIEVATIETLAQRLLTLLLTRDPLCERVHLNKLQLISIMMTSALARLLPPPVGGRAGEGGFFGKAFPRCAPLLASPLQGEGNSNSARGSSFYTAMRIMPPRERSAMYEIYHFCRAIDDIADDDIGNVHERLAQLQHWRNDIASIYAGNPPPHLHALAQAVAHFTLKKSDFLAVIDGMEMDVRGPIQAPGLATLEIYCDRVACAVGRLSVRVFNLADLDGLALAHHLGMALQLTNILRDLDEDAAINRLYLPRELLAQAGITTHNPAEALANPAIATTCEALAEKALHHFHAADQIMKPYERKAVRTPRIMSQAYRAILAALMQRGFAPPRPRVRLSKAKLGIIVLRNLLF